MIVFENSLCFTPTGKLNYCGIVNKYWDYQTRFCNQETKEEYIVRYKNIIYPFINISISIEDYNDKMLEDIMEKIINERSITIETFDSDYRHLIIDPYLIYLEKEKNDEDSNWGSAINFKINDNEELEKKLAVIPRSFTLEQNEKASTYLLSNVDVDGEIIGLALMKFLGVREKEACALDSNDIKNNLKYPYLYYIDVGYKSTVKTTSQLKLGSKTINSPRRIPLRDDFAQFILERINFVRKQLNDPNVVIPLVCEKKNYLQRSTSAKLTIAGRIFLRDVMKMRENDVSGLSLLLENEEFYEKDPTTYFLRRNFATELYCRKLSEAECKYLMGHDIDDKRYQRSDFVDTEVIEHMYQLMNLTDKQVIESINKRHN